ncbi:hypothetical protein EMMF5_005718 [Cystobasidiomycetes sp. EMM_F5]
MKKVTVVVLDRDDPDLAVTTGYNDVCFYKCDIADKAEIRHVAKRVRNEIGSPTMLINNAGIVAGRSLLELSEDEIERTFNVNVLAAFWLIKAFLPKMVEKKHGHIVNVSSLAGNIGCAGLSQSLCTNELRSNTVDTVDLIDLSRLLCFQVCARWAA